MSSEPNIDLEYVFAVEGKRYVLFVNKVSS